VVAEPHRSNLKSIAYDGSGHEGTNQDETKLTSSLEQSARYLNAAGPGHCTSRSSSCSFSQCGWVTHSASYCIDQTHTMIPGPICD
jgi:hypothetical protein